MKRFSFRLARLQKLRERHRDQKRLALAEAVEFRTRIERQLELAESARQAESNTLRSALSRPEISVDQAIRSRAYEGVLRQLQARLRTQLDQVNQVVAFRMKELTEAERDVKVLERLEERQLERYHQLENREEGAFMDELAARSAASVANEFKVVG